MVRRPPDNDAGSSSDAFGLDLDLRFTVPELPSGRRPRQTSRTVVIEAITPAELAAAWDGRGADRLWEIRRPSGRVEVALDRGGGAYRLVSRDSGRYVLSEDGARVLCALPGRAAGWPRFMSGQVLPLAALLRGLEVFHASAVSLGGEALALIGPSGAGKTTLAIELVRRGAALLTDDVLAVEQDGEALLAHRGAPVVSPRRGALAPAVGGPGLELGRVIARGAKGPRVLMQRDASPRPLTRLYFIRRTQRSGRPAVAPVDAGPRLLLGSSFNFVIRSRERVVRQLDVCAQLAQSVAAFDLSVPRGCSPGDVADQIAASALDHPSGVRR